MKIASLICTALVATSALAFSPSHRVAHVSGVGRPQMPGSVAFFPERERSVQRYMALESIEVILPSAIFLAAVAGTIYKANASDMDSETTETLEPVTEEVAVSEVVSEEIAVVDEEPAEVVVQEVSTPKKDISTVRKEVTSTLKGEKAKEERLKAAAAEARAAEKALEVASTTQSEIAAEAKVTALAVTEKKRSLLSKIWRIVKKIVAPWRKWESIA